MESKFEEIYQINVNGKTEKKNGLTYLSWAWAWAEFKKAYPDATYKVKRNELGLPWIYDEKTGYMVFTEVTADGLTYEMWLPVMDGANKAMKDKPYTYTTKFGEKTVESATMFDVNKTIMRCLVKNLAMFGLGLYIYAGEDLPEEIDEFQVTENKQKTNTTTIKKASSTSTTKKATDKISEQEAKTIYSMIMEQKRDLNKFLAYFKINNTNELTNIQYVEALSMLNNKK